MISRQVLVFCTLLVACSVENQPAQEAIDQTQPPDQLYLQVMGIAQDGGFPHADCQKANCTRYYQGLEEKKLVSCLAVVDPRQSKAWMFDATPSFTEQLHNLEPNKLQGIFLTHGHIGHYTGLMFLGREVMGSKNIDVYAMPRMQTFLAENGPWSQLADLQNIIIRPIQDSTTVELSDQFSVTALEVPHRDEFTETAGYIISGPNKSALFIPDIDKWEKWETDIVEVINAVDYAFVDGSFYDGDELPGRDMSEIPHPFIVESTALFAKLSETDKAKVHFIHFNHTNPLILGGHPRKAEVRQMGFNIAEEGQIVIL